MKKKLLVSVLSLVCVLACAFGLAACDFGGNSNGDKLDVAGYSYTFSSVDVKREDENLKELAEMIKEQTQQQMQGNTISFFKDSTCSLTDGADVTYGTYTQNGNKGTITFNGETNNISITENSISLSNIQQGINVIAVFTKGAGGNKPNQPEKPDEPQKPDKCEHIYDKYEIANEIEHIAYCVKCYDKKIEEHRFDGNVCICGYKYGEECNHYFIYEEYDIEIHIAYCYKCQTRIQEEHYFIDGEYCVCGMRKPVEEHRHVWSQTWETSDTHHWHNCTDKACNEINGYAKHDFANGDCVCGKAHPHVWSQTWENNNTHHWHNCTVNGCTEKSNYAKHDFSNGEYCIDCDIENPVEKLKYELNDDKQSYSVIGIGTVTASEIIIPSEYEGKPVTSIGDYAFKDCNGLTSVTIPDSITSIGYSAFRGCSSLTSITIPNSVTSIGSSAFRGCSSLTSITIPNSVTSIGSSAFYGCNKLEMITVGENNTAYASQNGILYNKAKTEFIHVPEAIKGAITIPDSVTIIGDYMFYGCSSLTSVTIPDSVTSIGYAAFEDCSSLTSVTIPNSVTSIGQSAFKGCSSITSVTIPDSVTSIGYAAFEDCSSLTSITIPNSVISIGSNAFSGCSSLTSIMVSENNTAYSSQDGILYNKTKTELIFAIRTIKGSVVVPNSVTSIGDYAFSGCSSLTSITIPDGVTSIGSNAFSYCSSLTSVIIPDSVTSIGYAAFYNCKGLTNLTIGNGVENIDDYTFFGCSNLTSVTIGNGVTSIDTQAFTLCKKLTEINYNGTKEQWYAIEKKSSWDEYSNNFTIHCTDGDITEEN